MFEDRRSAGVQLAQRLAGLALKDPVILALPRGGVPVAVEVACSLQAPLDLILVRKIGMPGNPELAAGAVVEGGEPVFNAALLRSVGLCADDFAAALARKRAEISVRRQLYLGRRKAVILAGRCVIVVDDGIATGATVRAALLGLRGHSPDRVILAIPVASPEVLDELRRLVDTVICLKSPQQFWAVGAHYRDFRQVDDAEVAGMLAAAHGAAAAKDKTT